MVPPARSQASSSDGADPIPVLPEPQEAPIPLPEAVHVVRDPVISACVYATAPRPVISARVGASLGDILGQAPMSYVRVLQECEEDSGESEEVVLPTWNDKALARQQESTVLDEAPPPRPVFIAGEAVKMTYDDTSCIDKLPAAAGVHLALVATKVAGSNDTRVVDRGGLTAFAQKALAAARVQDFPCDQQETLLGKVEFATPALGGRFGRLMGRLGEEAATRFPSLVASATGVGALKTFPSVVAVQAMTTQIIQTVFPNAHWGVLATGEVVATAVACAAWLSAAVMSGAVLRSLTARLDPFRRFMNLDKGNTTSAVSSLVQRNGVGGIAAVGAALLELGRFKDEPLSRRGFVEAARALARLKNDPHAALVLRMVIAENSPRGWGRLGPEAADVAINTGNSFFSGSNSLWNRAKDLMWHDPDKDALDGYKSAPGRDLILSPIAQDWSDLAATALFTEWMKDPNPQVRFAGARGMQLKENYDARGGARVDPPEWKGEGEPVTREVFAQHAVRMLQKRPVA